MTSFDFVKPSIISPVLKSFPSCRACCAAGSEGMLPGELAADQALSTSYFAHHDNPAVHMPYLRDKALMSAYRSAISQNRELIKGKVVMDLGCGPGMPLAMMCAQASKHEST